MEGNDLDRLASRECLRHGQWRDAPGKRRELAFPKSSWPSLKGSRRCYLAILYSSRKPEEHVSCHATDLSA